MSEHGTTRAILEHDRVGEALCPACAEVADGIEAWLLANLEERHGLPVA